MSRWARERMVRAILGACAVASAAAIVLIALVVLFEGRSALFAIPHTSWNPDEGDFGVMTMLAGSVAVTAGALVLAVPTGLGVALYLTEVAGPALGAVVRPFLQALAGIPSVVYGFVGLTLVIPAIRSGFGTTGFSLLAGALVLGVMILPTIAAVAEDALQALPPDYREGAVALGATPWQAVRRVLLPAARSGLVTAVVLGLGRALGETMAVLMVTGNAPDFPRSPLSPVRTLTSSIALEMGYAVGRHRAALFATGAVVLLLVIMVNAFARRFSR